MKRYSMVLVHNPEGFMEHKMLERLGGGYVLYDDAMAEIGSLQAEINRLNKAIKSATCEIKWLKTVVEND